MSSGVVERGAGTTGAGGSASTGASARTAPPRRRQRRAGRLCAAPGMAGTNARLTRSEVGRAAVGRLAPGDKRREAVKGLLTGEGTGGRLVQAPDGTLLGTSTIPAGVGISSVDGPQPQQYDSNMGKVLRINADGSIPKDN